MEIRLIGTLEEVEMATHELRRLFTVETERDAPAARKGWIRRYLAIYAPSLQGKGEEGAK